MEETSISTFLLQYQVVWYRRFFDINVQKHTRISTFCTSISTFWLIHLGPARALAGQQTEIALAGCSSVLVTDSREGSFTPREGRAAARCAPRRTQGARGAAPPRQGQALPRPPLNRRTLRWRQNWWIAWALLRRYMLRRCRRRRIGDNRVVVQELLLHQGTELCAEGSFLAGELRMDYLFSCARRGG